MAHSSKLTIGKVGPCIRVNCLFFALHNILQFQNRISMLCLLWLWNLSAICYLFCRNPKHRIGPSVSLSGSIFAAFDDVSIDDPDFGSIQGKKVWRCHSCS